MLVVKSFLVVAIDGKLHKTLDANTERGRVCDILAVCGFEPFWLICAVRDAVSQFARRPIFYIVTRGRGAHLNATLGINRGALTAPRVLVLSNSD